MVPSKYHAVGPNTRVPYFFGLDKNIIFLATSSKV